MGPPVFRVMGPPAGVLVHERGTRPATLLRADVGRHAGGPLELRGADDERGSRGDSTVAGGLRLARDGPRDGTRSQDGAPLREGPGWARGDARRGAGRCARAPGRLARGLPPWRCGVEPAFENSEVRARSPRGDRRHAWLLFGLRVQLRTGLLAPRARRPPYRPLAERCSPFLSRGSPPGRRPQLRRARSAGRGHRPTRPDRRCAGRSGRPRGRACRRRRRRTASRTPRRALAAVCRSIG
jgi:hypothetical protein